MNDFTYSYPMKVYFGEDAAQKAIYGRTREIRKESDACLWRWFH